jgi:hypothetical protein
MHAHMPARTHARTHASYARTGQALRALFPEWQTLWEEGSRSSPAPLPGQDVEEEQMTQEAQETQEREKEREDGKNDAHVPLDARLPVQFIRDGIESEEAHDDSDASAEWEHV